MLCLCVVFVCCVCVLVCVLCLCVVFVCCVCVLCLCVVFVCCVCMLCCVCVLKLHDIECAATAFGCWCMEMAS